MEKKGNSNIFETEPLIQSFIKQLHEKNSLKNLRKKIIKIFISDQVYTKS